MGDLINNIKAASEGTPYTGDGINKENDSNHSVNKQNSIMGNPRILQHSLDKQTGKDGSRVLHTKGES